MIYPRKTLTIPNHQPVVLRSPEDSDAKAILSYLKEVSGETHFLLRTPEEYTDTIESETLFIQTINQHPTQVMILVIDGDRVVGISNVGLKTKKKLKHRATLGISLRSSYWGLGIGSFLMDEMITIAKTFGAERLELEVIEGNTRAMHLYHKKGFTIMSEVKDAIKLSDGTYLSEYTMIKQLD